MLIYSFCENNLSALYSQIFSLEAISSNENDTIVRISFLAPLLFDHPAIAHFVAVLRNRTTQIVSLIVGRIFKSGVPNNEYNIAVVVLARYFLL